MNHTNPQKLWAIGIANAVKTHSHNLFGLLLLSCVTGTHAITPISTNDASSTPKVSCSVTKTNTWTGGYQLDVKVTNNGSSLNNWAVYLQFPQVAHITNNWNAVLIGNGTRKIAASNVGYNGTLAAGATTSFGFTGNTSGTFDLPTCSGSNDVQSSSSISSSSSQPSSVSKSSAPSSISSSQKSSVKSSASSIASSTASSSASSTSSSSDKQGVATHFESFGEPYGGCGIPQNKLETQNFVALNVFNSPGNYLYWKRPISGSDLKYLGEFNNGKNCGRWVRVTIKEACNGLNDGAQNLAFCREGSGWFNDGNQGAELDMIVADSCGDDNAWCRDSRYHLDLATAAVKNQFAINGQAVNLLPDHFNNRKISWRYIDAPNYQGDINIYFMQGAEKYWPAISINHLERGIHGVEQLINGVWTPVAMNSDMGQAYLLQGGVSQFQIRVYDANDQLINGGRVYTFSFPTACGGKCTAPTTLASYTIQ